MVTPWFLIVGLLFLGVALVSSYVRRLPLSTAMLYLAAGCSFGPQGVGLIEMEPIRQGPLIELVTEIAVITSLFTAGLSCEPRLTIPIGGPHFGLHSGQ